jgi:hypothetical protein
MRNNFEREYALQCMCSHMLKNAVESLIWWICGSNDSVVSAGLATPFPSFEAVAGLV